MEKKKFVVIGISVVVIIMLLAFLLISLITIPPQNIHITNLTDQSVVVSYTTNKPTSGEVLAYTKKWRLMLPFVDRFLTVAFKDKIIGKSTVHYIELTNLIPNHTYYYKISDSWNVATLKTAQPREEIGQPSPAYGHIFEKNGKTGANGVIIYIGELSALTNKEGNWTLDLSPLGNVKQINLSVEGGEKGTVNSILNLDKVQPTPNFFLK